MTGDELREHLREVLDADALSALVAKYGIQERERKLDVFEFVVALILAGGTHEGGRQYDVLRTYADNSAPAVVRGTFYAWFTEPLQELLSELLSRAMAVGRRQPMLLPGILGGVTDWRVIDSTTVRLNDALLDTFQGTGDYAALKIHKEWSVGTGNLVSYKITPARDHDSPHLIVDEHRRGTGLLVDLASASIERLMECDMYDVQYVVRLKENWKPTVDRLVRGGAFREAVEGADFDALLDEELVVLDGQAIDADVTVGRGAIRVPSRLVGVPTPKGYCFFLTNVARKTHGPHQIGDLYRIRWEIEISHSSCTSCHRSLYAPIVEDGHGRPRGPRDSRMSGLGVTSLAPFSAEVIEKRCRLSAVCVDTIATLTPDTTRGAKPDFAPAPLGTRCVQLSAVCNCGATRSRSTSPVLVQRERDFELGAALLRHGWSARRSIT